jgi:hypothetical protein
MKTKCNYLLEKGKKVKELNDTEKKEYKNIIRQRQRVSKRITKYDKMTIAERKEYNKERYLKKRAAYIERNKAYVQKRKALIPQAVIDEKNRIIKEKKIQREILQKEKEEKKIQREILQKEKEEKRQYNIIQRKNERLLLVEEKIELLKSFIIDGMNAKEISKKLNYKEKSIYNILRRYNVLHMYNNSKKIRTNIRVNLYQKIVNYVLYNQFHNYNDIAIALNTSLQNINKCLNKLTKIGVLHKKRVYTITKDENYINLNKILQTMK